MHSLNSALLAEMIKSKRGKSGLRETAAEIGGISAPTLSRIENGNLPDIDTYFRICKWLDVPTDYFAIKTNKNFEKKSSDTKQEVIAHLRADKTLPPSTAQALIEMINLAYAKIAK
ncbi:helix-turn-helix domain-containing protein [Flavihumibacter sp. UBA7668]|uniref:helix-turn-helix domain-containing protein n=1 Tax=Flavihumibacter sp. UBA7668 TaxID=1946542 RepID=UPI001A3A1629|nr:helix-turn-helix transcriptional regulator [Flavihumibacter sp. UBA7668]MBL7767502.1 helix-turn-helix transcriptional regulator [Flavipsychrobacter sp.]